MDIFRADVSAENFCVIFADPAAMDAIGNIADGNLGRASLRPKLRPHVARNPLVLLRNGIDIIGKPYGQGRQPERILIIADKTDLCEIIKRDAECL